MDEFFFFFFQAEDGIRDFHVTGVQTCALPICWCTLLGKYASRLRPLRVKLPEPGRIRTRTMASLRRPTVWIGRSVRGRLRGAFGAGAAGVSTTVSATAVVSAASAPSVTGLSVTTSFCPSSAL